MPTYEYKCSECGYTFELFQSMSAEPVKVCPKCNGYVKRLIGPGLGPIFKGTGFYETDYKNKSNNTSSGKNSSKSKPTPSSK
jgi:putative FmdB family regulatory protein